MATHVPKFASFRPKPKELSEPPKDSRKSEKPERTTKDRPSRDRSSRHEVEGNAHDHGKETSRPFFSDRRGDPDIVRYGGLNRYDIPSYRRYGHGYVLGLSPEKKIDREYSTGKEIFVTPAKRRREDRLLTDKYAARERSRAIRFVAADEDQSELEQDFIKFSTTVKRKRDGDEDEDATEVDYRGIEGDRSLAELSNPDDEYESDVELGMNSEVTQQNSLLIRRTREHPTDPQAWLDLIDHQEAMMRLDHSSAELSSFDKRHLADVRITTYEEALKKVSNDPTSRIKLYVGLMDEASKVWNESKLASKWVEILQRYPQNLELWLKYLDFIQSSFAGYKYEGCRANFFKCFRALRSGSGETSTESYLHVLIRLTSMIQQAGYQELALAIWQALMEYNLLKPTSSTSNRTEEDIRLFEEFWESEAPRIGEEGAKGWCAFNPDDSQPAAPGPIPLQKPLSSRSMFTAFRIQEVESMSKLRYPGRTTDDAGEDDPFHLILFSDIEEYIKLLPSGPSATLILEAFFCFAGLPPLPRIGLNQATWWSDPFMCSQFRRRSHENEKPSFVQTVRKFADSPLNGFQMTTDLLFDEDFKVDSTMLSANFIHRVLKLLVTDATRDEVIGEYLLAFELKHFPSEVFKTAKQLLKARSSSLRLYNAYGLVESNRGNFAKSDQVFSAALSMQKGDTPFPTSAGLQLLSSWVWEALRQGEKSTALWRLVSANGQVPTKQSRDAVPDQAAMLRARSVLTESNERALLGRDYSSAILSNSLLALIAYLSSNLKAEAALTVFYKLTTWFDQHNLSQSPFAELHSQSIAHFLTYHATNAPIVKPSLLRSNLEPLISRFPNNTILLSLYAANEARFSIDDRVRGIMYHKLLQNSKESSIVGWSFAIHYEMLKGELAGSTSHSIRALFKKAQEGIGAHCPALWKAHILFEIEEAGNELAKRPNKRPRQDGKKHKHETKVEEAVRRVKETFFKGLTELPWCKDYMMIAFTDLQDLEEEVLSEQELRRVYNVMVEKELRTYTDLDLD